MNKRTPAIKRLIRTVLYSFRPTQRGMLWIALLWRLRGSCLKDELGLIVSAAIDTLTFTFRPDRAVSPSGRFSALVYSHGLNVGFHIRGGTDDLYNVLPFREGDVHDAILDHLKEGDVFVDGGANVGYYSVLGAKKVGPDGRVVAVEPIPATIEQLRRNIAANKLPNVDVITDAISFRSGQTLPMHVVGGGFGRGALLDQLGVGESQSFGVTTTTIDDICKKHNRISLIKLDIEGAEFDALQGAQATLQKTDALVIECNQDRDAIMNLLQSSGFVVSELNFTTYILAKRHQ